MSDDERLDLVRKASGCAIVYPILGFPGYFITKFGEVYSFKRTGQNEPGDTPRKMRASRYAGKCFVPLSVNGTTFRRSTAFLLEHAQHGVNPSVDKLKELQRLYQELDATRMLLDAALSRIERLQGSRVVVLADAS